MNQTIAQIDADAENPGQIPAAADHQTIPWNLVTRNIVGHEFLRKKIHEKIVKLETHLKHFPAGTTHLHIALDRHARKNLFTAALTLRVPSNIVYAKKSSGDVIKALNDAVKAVLRELESLKSGLRREALWKRKRRREELRDEIKGAAFTDAPQPDGAGPQEQGEVVEEFLRQNYAGLLRHVRRSVLDTESSGDAPGGEIDPRRVVDEVVRQTMTGWRGKPGKPDWLAWLYQLTHEEMRRRREAGEISREMESMEETPAQPLDAGADEWEPLIAELRESVPDPAAVPPDEAVARKDLLEFVQSRIQSWPRIERDLFNLHFIEGFESGDVAMIVGVPPRAVHEMIGGLHERMRHLLIEESAI